MVGYKLFPVDMKNCFWYHSFSRTVNIQREVMETYGLLRNRTRTFLLDQISRGVLKPGQRLPSVRCISKSLDVSTKVAFQVIQELKSEQILEQLPNGRHLVRKGASVGESIQNLRIAFSSCGLDHIRHTVYQSIYHHLTQNGRSVNAEMDCLLEMNDTWSSLTPNYFDAIVVADWKPQNISNFSRGPIIGIDSWEGIDVDCVVKTDHFMGGVLAGKHLRDQGRKHVVYWDVVKEKGDLLKGMSLRWIGFQKGWVDGGGSVGDIKYLPVFAGTENLNALVAEHIRGADAFFVYCDSNALIVWEVLKKMGVRVPDDLALMGFDGTYEALKCNPSLTTVRQPCREIAEKVLDLILAEHANPHSIHDREYLIPPNLIVGGTT
jgi:DNA-binding LacI/PurR family transcriptional regulator